jgi:hypothetical protein
MSMYVIGGACSGQPKAATKVRCAFLSDAALSPATTLAAPWPAAARLYSSTLGDESRPFAQSRRMQRLKGSFLIASTELSGSFCKTRARTLREELEDDGVGGSATARSACNLFKMPPRRAELGSESATSGADADAASTRWSKFGLLGGIVPEWLRKCLSREKYGSS